MFEWFYQIVLSLLTYVSSFFGFLFPATDTESLHGVEGAKEVEGMNAIGADAGNVTNAFVNQVIDAVADAKGKSVEVELDTFALST